MGAKLRIWKVVIEEKAAAVQRLCCENLGDGPITPCMANGKVIGPRALAIADDSFTELRIR
ncbi:MAG: hypothetical protein A2428_13620 [Bdellovibrionales bacterium RIFOXYC1_FULL_54_43]|nr:MAG: hypothetical protein A2428_13620 [Bdellovibrionales bacterium RIFOXYC1_FULL_54_43]OFZ83179.1 MAG: hypothetical protein A2603_00360 [Bdellovibrionales bacterium RIFOXYD1_FULL_55_31]